MDGSVSQGGTKVIAQVAATISAERRRNFMLTLGAAGKGAGAGVQVGEIQADFI